MELKIKFKNDEDTTFKVKQFRLRNGFLNLILEDGTENFFNTVDIESFKFRK